MILGREALGRFVLARPTPDAAPGVFVIAADVGTFTLTGQASIGDQTAFVLDGEFGSYFVAGQAAEMTKGRPIAADQGSYTLTGQDITDPPFGLQVDVGAYTVGGQDAGVVAARYMTGDAGSYTLTVFDTGTAVTLPCDVGAFILTGQTAPRKTDGLIAERGTFTLTGQDALFSIVTLLDAEAGEYLYSGQNIAFELLRAPVGIQANPRLGRPIVAASRAPQPIRIRSNYLRASGQ